MQIVIGMLRLANPGGVESYCLTVARELDRLGHEVTLTADDLGPLADRAAEGGFNVARETSELPTACAAVFANDAISAGLLGARYPDARLVFCVHSTRDEMFQPPLAPGLIDAIVAPSERFAAHARALALDVDVIRLTQPIDTTRFALSHPPNSPPQRALLLGNYLDGRRRAALVETWAAAGIECLQVGFPDDVVFDVRPYIAEADIVVAKARAALEGMACGKAVYVFDAFGGDGWVTADNYATLEADNFAGLATDRQIDRSGLAADLEDYDPDMGWVNRELAAKHHESASHVQRLLEVLRGPPTSRRESSASHVATARTLRTAWRAQLAAASATREAQRTVNTALAQVDQARDQAGAGAAEVEAWRARALEAERALAATRELIGTRRVQAGIAVGRGLDRVRGRR